MIKDAMTAKVIGLLLIVFPLIINSTILMAARHEGDPSLRYLLVALVPSLPLMALGTWLIRKGYSMPNDGDD
ncbi:MAG: hypothetical protein JNL38_13565 [Myxococcales bacterium]|jgi:hypothetical protein|nr:hypothetical protein [Myxococcales bacterium]